VDYRIQTNIIAFTDSPETLNSELIISILNIMVVVVIIITIFHYCRLGWRDDSWRIWYGGLYGRPGRLALSFCSIL